MGAEAHVPPPDRYADARARQWEATAAGGGGERGERASPAGQVLAGEASAPRAGLEP